MLLCAMNLITKDKGRRIMFHKKSLYFAIHIIHSKRLVSFI